MVGYAMREESEDIERNLCVAAAMAEESFIEHVRRRQSEKAKRIAKEKY